MADERQYIGEPTFAPAAPTATGIMGGASLGQKACERPSPPINALLAELQSSAEMLHPQLDKLLEKLAPVLTAQPPSPCGPEQPVAPGGSEYASRMTMAIQDLRRLSAKIVDAAQRLEI